MKWLGVLVIILGVVLLFTPAGMSVYDHGLEYGWNDAFKKILLPVLKVISFFSLGVLFIIVGLFIIKSGWADIIKTFRKK